MKKNDLFPREEKIQETIALCKESFFRQEQTCHLTWWEFLWSQLRYTRKRWWMLQAALLMFAVPILLDLTSDFVQMRTTGVIGCLFVVLMIPELWRNRESEATQVEAACLYSLRQIYTARITLFGIVDVALMTVFCLSLGQMGFTLVEVMAHFLLPATVTACICFCLFCGKPCWNESVSLSACLLWGAAWWLILMNETIYISIVPAVWTALFGIALAILVLAVRRTIQSANLYWEVDFFEITAG